MPDQHTGVITEIEVEHVGMIRLPNMWQWARIKRVRGLNREFAQLAAACSMTIQQFKQLPLEKRQEVWAAYLSLTSPTNVGRSAAPENGPASSKRASTEATRKRSRSAASC
ncbi:hypothetical protein [Mesorhizobium sp. ANAO-SY3R2]|uniref:hypothetical protein n=1 Tax=Mesorhizobium sp. ANAO-SY3R2 TaxID=3166644 RepID=UPI003670C0A7